MVKKFLVSGFVIIGFLLYSFSQRKNRVLGTNSVTAVNTLESSLGTINNNYKDGEYTGDVVDAYFGNVQVKVAVQGGRITDVQFLDYPQDRRNSIAINTRAMPHLKAEAIQAQSASVDIVSGATATSQAFRESLRSALIKSTQT